MGRVQAVAVDNTSVMPCQWCTNFNPLSLDLLNILMSATTCQNYAGWAWVRSCSWRAQRRREGPRLWKLMALLSCCPPVSLLHLLSASHTSVTSRFLSQQELPLSQLSVTRRVVMWCSALHHVTVALHCDLLTASPGLSILLAPETHDFVVLEDVWFRV